MTITLSKTEYWDILESKRPIISNEFENLYQFPEALGKGYQREFTFSNGLLLEIYDYELQDDLSLKMPVREHPVEFDIRLAGNFGFWGNKKEKEIHVKAGESSLCGNGIAAKGISNYKGGQQNFGINVHIEPDLLTSFFCDSSEPITPELQLLIKGKDWQNWFPNLKISPAMQLVTQQIINCPYQGFTQRMYLQSKVFELLALHLELLQPDKKTQIRANKLNKEDIERIHQAKNILLARFHNPPSLLELSREAGLNDFKLKIGFHHCFGTTVFGYLHQYRMEQARQLLKQGNLTIAGVARAVGYANRSHFSSAFKRKFGVNPSIYNNTKLCK
ncbi:helix-turn-helix transcriptional regulator [Calothrix sp. CCY 0018]|uniref:helix-turn-helix transcriptional regulator n=1 Tax=Calothrix sp. CCY 0018 TaxID=3103864 RepID=UPI0039C7579F